MGARLAACLVLAAMLLASGSAGAARERRATALARAFTVEIAVPGSQPVVAGSVRSPKASTAADAYTFPDDGSVLTAQAVTSNAAKRIGALSRAAASVGLAKLSLFGGEITADAVTTHARAVAGAAGASGDFDQTTVTNLVVLGQPVTATPDLRVPLADWGYAVLLAEGIEPGSPLDAPSYRGSVTAIAVHLVQAHGGLPAGSQILIGYAEASVRRPAPLPSPPVSAAPLRPPAVGGAPSVASTRSSRREGARLPQAPEPKQSRNGIPAPLILPPPNVRPALTAGHYVFPVYGPSAYTDTFGAPRADVGYHHGDDIFAPLGAPLLAVADGTVFSVGWNNIGGYRLWLRDAQGNEFYYAHLSAYTTLAVNGRHVPAGAVLGFVGDTGDAITTPYHLHFEVHPVSLLYLGYDGAVDPTSYLSAWRHLTDIRIGPAGRWAPAVAPVSGAPTPGAILLQSTDISSADGLDPGSLQRALAAVANEGDAALVGGAGVLPRG
jgi:murein DD-endopeptidase MepM/ murein hydrolase activator NlpD